MDDVLYTKPPAWRRAGANLIDMAFTGSVWWLALSRGPVGEGTARSRLMAIAGNLLREQVRSPGQRLFGTLTVDRRTGRRLALWRTIAVFGSRVAGAQITRRLEPARTPERERAREAAGAEIAEIMRRHPQATPEREAELAAAHDRHSSSMPSLARAVGPSVVVGLLTTRLSRRLAPTVEILARRRADHSP
jgi:hypothetical protein